MKVRMVNGEKISPEEKNIRNFLNLLNTSKRLKKDQTQE
jgi:hypothetical protein